MPHSTTQQGRRDSGLLSLALIARYYHIPAEPEALRHRFCEPGKTFDAPALVRAAHQLGLKARCLRSDWRRLEQAPLPAIVRQRDGRFIVIARLGNDRALIQDPEAQRPVTLPREAFEASWSGEVILFTRRAGTVNEAMRFGFRWFLPAIVRHRRLFGEVLIASFFVQLFALVTPLFFQVVIDKVLVHRGLTTLDVLAFGLLVVSLFEVILGGLRTYVFAHTANRIDVQLGARLFRHLLALPLSYFESRRVGDSVARVRELENIRSFITGSALTVLLDVFFTVVFLAVMYYYSPMLTAIVLGAIPCYILLSALVTPVLRARVNEKFSRGAENQAFLVESVNAVETVKAMAVEPQMQRRWEEQLAGYVQTSFRAANLGNIAGQLAGFINKAVVVLILWIGARAVIEGALSVGQLVAFNMLAARVSGPILRLVQLWQDFQQAGVSVQRLGDILNTPTEPSYQQQRSALPQLEGRITLDRVSFRYQSDGPEVLANLSLDVPAGQVLGVIGRSGSGKSTLTKLIQRLYVPERGRILVDGVDLAMVDAAWLRRNVGVVLQENVLFNRTVRENIALVDPGMPMEAVIRAARLAGAHDFILEMPEGYDTLVGERGSSLSGGQRQRIAIARALVTDPRILILDEATSALDYESERIIQRNMRAICQGRTVVIVAHRLSSMRHADRIIVLDKGMLIEQGTHDELLLRGGQYARLHALQSGVGLQAING